MKTIISCITFCFYFMSLSGQIFDVDTLLYNGDPERFINVVILGDGYMENELETFSEDALSFSDALFGKSPFDQYKNYFNVFIINVPSNESGADHPGTASDEPTNPLPMETVDTYFDATFDSGGIHRLLTVNNSKATSVVFSNIVNADQIVVLVNSNEYGGSGGFTAVSSTNASANEIAIHEIGHSFSDLGDEYYAGDQFSRERPNMTMETDPGSVKWTNWIGEQGVDVYQHCCGGMSESWYKPHEQCLMRSLNREFCPVCKETTIEVIHDLTNIIQNISIMDDEISVDQFPIEISVDLLVPNPNTVVTKWILNGNEYAVNENTVSLSEADLSQRFNSLEFIAEDKNDFLRVDFHSDKHGETVLWIIENTLAAIDADGDGFNEDEDCDDTNAEIYPGAVEIPDNGIDEDCDGMDGATSSTELIIEGKRISYYPSPASDKLRLEMEGKFPLSVSIVDMKAQVLKTLEIDGAATISLEDIISGQYVLEFYHKASGKKVSEKFIVEK